MKKKEAKNMEQYKKGLIKGIEKGPSRKDKVKYTGGLGYCWFFFYKPALIVLFLKSRFGLDNLPQR